MRRHGSRAPGGRRRAAGLPALTAAGLVAGLLAGCSTASAEPAAIPAASIAATPRAAVTPTPPTAQQRAAAVVAGMSRSERAGQLLMTAATVDGLAALKPLVRRYHLAGVMVRGRSAAGADAVHRRLAPLQRAAPEGLPLLTATDQEGGTVQVLTGHGFSRMPSAVEQGRRPASALRKDAARWGRQLADGGVTLNLGPVADVPCAGTLHDNPPVADLRRQYGSDPARAGAHVAAVVRGMRSAGVDTAVKHFPGLGCVRANTDTDADVVDAVTGASSSRLSAFAAGIDAEAGFVMMSSASYAKIDPGVPALFSSRIIGELLRGRLGFEGVVMSDDVGGAAALRDTGVRQRAVRFVAAGGDLLLDIVPGHVPALHDALVDRAESNPGFDRKLTAAAERVVAARLRLADG